MPCKRRLTTSPAPTYLGYDKYRYDLDEIVHNPHELASFLIPILPPIRWPRLGQSGKGLGEDNASRPSGKLNALGLVTRSASCYLGFRVVIQPGNAAAILP